VVDVNKAALEWYHVASKAALRVNLSQLVGPEGYESFIEELIALAEGRTHYELVSARQGRDGNLLHLIINGTVAPGYQDSWGRVLVSILDITERKQAEQALRESEKRFRVIFEHANDAIHLDAADDQILQVNPRMCELMGYSREELLTMRISDLQAPEMRGHPGHVIRNELARHGSTAFEGLNLHSSGRRIPVEISVARIESAQGDLYVSIVRDITERKRAEETLRASEERFRRMFQHSASGMVLVSPNFYFLQVNDAFCKMLGYTESELLEKTFQDVTLPEDRPVGGELVRRVLSGEMETFRLEKRYLHKDGTVVWGLVSSTLIRDTQNKPLHFVTQIQDITERKRAEEALRDLAARQEALLAAVPDIIMEVDNNKVYTWANQAGIEFFGDNVIGKEAAFYFEGEQHTYAVVQPLFNGEENTIYLESWQRRRDGQKRLLAWWCRGLKDDRGNTTGALSSGRDITERKRAELALNRRAAQLALINDIGKRIAAALDPAEVLERATRLVQASFGYHHVALFTVDREQGALVMRARAGDFAHRFLP
jgi:PAS domain S-box-containing protein